MLRIAHIAMVLIATLALPACESDSSTPTPTPTPSADTLNYQPWSVGNRWTYDVVDADAPTANLRYHELVKIAGTQMLKGRSTHILLRSDTNGQESPTRINVAKTTDALLRVVGPADTPPGPAVDEFTLLKFPLESGAVYPTQEWHDLPSSYDEDNDGINEKYDLKIEISVLAPESVAVPAGTFSDAIPVSTVTTWIVTLSSDGSERTVAETLKEWHVANIGVAKRVSTTVANSTPAYHHIQAHLLTGYNVGHVSTDTVAPTVEMTLPAADTTIGLDQLIYLRFSEAIDLDSLRGTGIILTNAKGQVIAGEPWTFDGAAWYFPLALPPSGTYTVTVGSSVLDLLGNPLGSTFSWSYGLDSTRPAVISSAPAANETRVAIESDVRIDFSESLIESSVSHNVRVTGPGTPYFSSSFSGSQLILHPIQPWHFDTTYTVTVGADITDLHANTMGSPHTFQFTTRPSLFLPPEYLITDGWTEAAAIGDLNGDGRNDVVTASLLDAAFPAPSSGKLFVYYQRGDGTLDLPKTYDIGVYCITNSIAIGDVTGDGNNDIVLSKFGCDSIQIFERTGSDDWVNSRSIATNAVTLIRLGDMNHDGGIDVVGSTWSGDYVYVWYQIPQSGLQTTAATYRLAHSAWGDLEVGDINGDGLTDIVVSGPSVGSVTQLAGGGFSSPSYRDTGPGGSNSVAIGDVNGDGRQDLVVGSGTGKVGVFLQQSNGALDAMASPLSNGSPRPIEVADLDHDGRNDILGVVASSVVLNRQDSQGNLQPQERFQMLTSQMDYPHGLAIGDINGDGYKDAVIALTVQGLMVLYNSGR